MSRADDCRVRAEECLTKSEACHSAAMREEFAALAQQWLKIADDLDFLDRLTRQRGPSESETSSPRAA